jgi:hypothetical protein
MSLPVTSCADDGSPGTLRKVIEGAADGDTVDMSALACSVITLQSGALQSGVPNLLIQGPGASALTIDGNQTDRVLLGKNLDIADVTLAHGLTSDPTGGGCVWADGDLTLTRANLTACAAVVSTASAPGGATVVIGNLEMHDSLILGSTAIGLDHAGGGGALVIGSAKLYNSTISGNTAQSTQSDVFGGGLSTRGSVELHASTIADNRATSIDGRTYGGGIHTQGDVDVSVLENSTISNNSASSDTNWSYGGGLNSGIYSQAYVSMVIVDHSAVTANTAYSNCISCAVGGGGVHAFDSITSDYSSFTYNSALCNGGFSTCATAGGGLDSFGTQADSQIAIRNTTISGNVSTGGGSGVGGGLMTPFGKQLIATNSTIAFNHASHDGGGIASNSPPNLPSGLNSTIVANNDIDSGPNDIGLATPGATTFTGAQNIVMNIAGGVVTVPGDTLTADPQLLPLATDQGGTTAVHPLDATSPALNAGNNSNLLGCDQRGFPYHRVNGPAADIGAYEAQEHPIFADSFDNSSVCPHAAP